MSVMDALATFTPLLCVPIVQGQREDQDSNAAAVQRLGVGIWVPFADNESFDRAIVEAVVSLTTEPLHSLTAKAAETYFISLGAAGNFRLAHEHAVELFLQRLESPFEECQQ